MKYHYTLIKMAKMTTLNADEDGEKLDRSYNMCNNAKWHSHLRKSFSNIKQSTNTQPTFMAISPFLSVCRITCMQKFIAVLCGRVKT